MFLDEAVIYVKGGDGGDGCISFRREKYVPKGGPDGGKGGNGGDVVLYVSESMETLLDLSSSVKYEAADGRPGEGSNRTGKSGRSLTINIPPGTIVKDRDTGLTLKDFTKAGDSLIIAKGGRGGHGNKHYSTPVNRTPRIAQDGKAGAERWIKLELKLMADAGLIGLPNAGKSTLLSRVSAVKPKIGGYPFTTLYPQLGVVALDDYARFVVADIPGLIEGAHNGVGLGDEFLRHIERTRILVHLVDVAPIDGSDPVESYYTVRNELELFNAALTGKPEIVVANKMDMMDEETGLMVVRAFEEKLSKKVYPVSAVTGSNIELLKRAIGDQLGDAPK